MKFIPADNYLDLRAQANALALIVESLEAQRDALTLSLGAERRKKRPVSQKELDSERAANARLTEENETLKRQLAESESRKKSSESAARHFEFQMNTRIADNEATREHYRVIHKTLSDLWDFCVDRGYLSPDDETEGVEEIVKALATTPEQLGAELAELRDRLKKSDEYIKSMDSLLDEFHVARSCINPLEDMRRAIAGMVDDRALFEFFVTQKWVVSQGQNGYYVRTEALTTKSGQFGCPIEAIRAARKEAAK